MNMMGRQCTYTRTFMLIVVVCLLSASPTTAAKEKQAKKRHASEISVSPEFYNMCSHSYSGVGMVQPLPQKGGTKKKLQWLIEASGKNTLLLPTSPQHLAACWILYRDTKRSGKSKSVLLQRYTLATLHFATTHSNTTVWDWNKVDLYDPRAKPPPAPTAKPGKNNKKNAANKQAVQNKTPHHWMSEKHHECTWHGVECNWRSTIVQMDLGFLKLDGLLPRELALLTDLRDLDLHGNDLQGVLPHKILVSLTKLETLRLYMNGFFGALHREIAGLTSLKELSMFGNYMSSPIPTELGELKQLQVIDMYANNLNGRIPSQLGQLKQLQYLDLHDNDLTGSVPQEICQLPHLKVLITDCLGPKPEVTCDCCTVCCRGLPDMKCADVETGKEIR
jgi:Leucine-rich repeat (LRR) protein